jgi:AhpD family alkylhydroperoxidase
MKLRLHYQHASPATIEAISTASTKVSSAFLDAKLKILVELRVSQINGCAFCIDLHSHEAREHGEKQQRLDCLPVWREVSFFTPRECAAFAWAEAVTLVAQTHVPDDVFEMVSPHFSEDELVQITVIIGQMNLWNRLSIGFRNAPAERRLA